MSYEEVNQLSRHVLPILSFMKVTFIPTDLHGIANHIVHRFKNDTRSPFLGTYFGLLDRNIFIVNLEISNQYKNFYDIFMDLNIFRWYIIHSLRSYNEQLHSR